MDKTLPDGVVTFLMTDVEQSTRLWSQDPSAMEVAHFDHVEVINQCVYAHHGAVIRPRNRGDSIFSVFDRASHAVHAAIDIQISMHKRFAGSTCPIRVRIGIHSGEAILRDGDYFGDSVNRCARIRDAGHGGQVLLSAATRSLSKDGVTPLCSLKYLGEFTLDVPSGIRESLYQVVHPGLQTEYPELRTPGSIANNLPVFLSEFVGREDEIAAIRGLAQRHRLVSLIGAGGVGKTRIAIEVGREMLLEYPRGVWFVELDSVLRGDAVGPRVAEAIGLREVQGIGPMESIKAFIGAEECLIVLDNCEHVMPEVTEFVTALLKLCPTASVLATSREGLSVGQQQAFTIHPMSLPASNDTAASIEELMHFDATELFSRRARAADSTFRVTEGNASDVAQLCTMLDGVPLAIELVAPLVRTMTVKQIISRLESSALEDLRSFDPTVSDRHRSIRTMIDWGNVLLDAREQDVSNRLAVFPGTFSLHAAQAICSDEDLSGLQVFGIINSLLQKSIIQKISTATEIRFRMLWTIRQYAFEQLATDGNHLVWRRRHAEFFFALLDGASESFEGEGQNDWLESIDIELPNIRQATAQLLSDGQVDDCLERIGGLWRFFFARGRLSEGISLIQSCIDAADPGVVSEALAEALHGAGTLSSYVGDLSGAREKLTRAIEIWDATGDTDKATRSRSNLASVLHREGDARRAGELWQSCLDHLDPAVDPYGVAIIQYNVGLVHQRFGRLIDAKREFARSHRYFRQNAKTTDSAAYCGISLSDVYMELGEYDVAQDTLDDALDLISSLDNATAEADVRYAIARADFLVGMPDSARSQSELALAYFRTGAEQSDLANALSLQTLICLECGDLLAAEQLAGESASVLGVIEKHESLGQVLLALGRFAQVTGDRVRARHRFAECIAEFQELDRALETLDAVDYVCALLADQDDLEAFTRFHSWCEQLREFYGFPRKPYLQSWLESAHASVLDSALINSDCPEPEAWDTDWLVLSNEVYKFLSVR